MLHIELSFFDLWDSILQLLLLLLLFLNRKGLFSPTVSPGSSSRYVLFCTNELSITLITTLMWHTFLLHSESQAYIYDQLWLIYAR